MKIFKISGKFQQNEQWSNLESDFSGYFVKENNSDAFIGYVEETVTHYNPVRYIKGQFLEEKNQLFFIKLVDEKGLSPLLYAFPDINEIGLWTGYSRLFKGFYGPYEKAKIIIEEVHDENSKLHEQIIKKCEQSNVTGIEFNVHLIENVEKYQSYLEEFEERVLM